ncbi:citrate lyase beta subunit [Pararhizobium capsulatum DSM 1112]|uniref:Citrate lyase beta subunit n=1 Tax=Pararhizobium capsulatum DSM 1112 TaxID=1121113 RepID=A0ABU0BPA3_9HYPH|nr:hypothetical protein [Pararhizobium capsulatum]MDQ0320080.1 citrate lyase beta subunit [Pararhizobium capsulatum DSM 1112]
MSVNAPNIFPQVLLVPLGPSTPPLPTAETFALIIDPGTDWQSVSTSPHIQALRASCPSNGTLFLRIDSLPDACEEALARFLAMGIEGIVLAGCSGTRHIQHLATLLRVAEANANRTDGSTRIMAELGGVIEAFLPPRPLASSRLSAAIFSEDAAIAATGTEKRKGTNAAVDTMRTSTLLMAAQARISSYLLGDGPAEEFSGRVVLCGGDPQQQLDQRLGRNISNTSPASQ